MLMFYWKVTYIFKQLNEKRRKRYSLKLLYIILLIPKFKNNCQKLACALFWRWDYFWVFSDYFLNFEMLWYIIIVKGISSYSFNRIDLTFIQASSMISLTWHVFFDDLAFWHFGDFLKLWNNIILQYIIYSTIVYSNYKLHLLRQF